MKHNKHNKHKHNRILFFSVVLLGIGVIAVLIGTGIIPVNIWPLNVWSLKQHEQYTLIDNVSKFNSIINDKSHNHVVVWFYDYATSGNEKEMAQSMKSSEYENMAQLYNKVADIEQYKDKNSRFLAVNVATPEGHKIFSEYSVLDDDTLVELPAILLFRDGKMIDNQMGGAMNEERIEAFIERYFKKK